MEDMYANFSKDIRFFWQICAFETGFYSFTSVPCRAMGDSEGFFTVDECRKIDEEFAKIDNPKIPRKTSEISAVEYEILSKALEPNRMAEYLNLKYDTSSSE